MGIINLIQNRKNVMGMNKRNLFYIRKHNKSKAKEIADDKLLTKIVLNNANIPTPKLLAVINDYHEFKTFDWNSLPNSFVIKPVKGLEGNGIDIFYNRDKNGNWIRADRSRASVDELKNLAYDIISGRFSLHQEPDKVMFEERIKLHKRFKYYTYKGAPDIRLIVFNKVPIMAMLRLPTRDSRGKANLALGAIGAGIDIASGTTTNAIHGKSGKIEFIPGTKLRVSGLKIPYWNTMLESAINAQIATNLNFAAVDFLLDRDQGPVIVELNARPGLSIQIANNDGMRWRTRKAIGLKVKTAAKGIRIGKDLFGGEIEAGIESISGKDVIGIYENIKLYDKDNESQPAKAKIDTGADSTSIDKRLAKKLGFSEIVELADELPQDFKTVAEAREKAEELAAELMDKYEDLADIRHVSSSHGLSLRPYIRVTLKIQDTKFETVASIYDRSKLKYPVIVGRKSLNKFIVDPAKK